MRRETVHVQGARENNLKNVDVEIPRDKLVVVTGVSGSGKSSLAFDTIFAEGQRRLMGSMSTFARRFVAQLKKPNVDFVNGLSPVVSIDQKTVSKNPRSTVGTMTDISDYLRMLWALIGTPHCPFCDEACGTYSPQQMAERILSLPEGTEIEIRTPVLPLWGESWDVLFDYVRRSGFRRARLNGERIDLGEHHDLDESAAHMLEVVVDNVFVGETSGREIVASLQDAEKVGDGLFIFDLVDDVSKEARGAYYEGFGCREHHVVSLRLKHRWFGFNDPTGACRTCSGLGTALRCEPRLIVPDESLSIQKGALAREVIINNPDAWGGRVLYTLTKKLNFDLDTPWSELPEDVVEAILYGVEEVLLLEVPPNARSGHEYAGREFRWQGAIPRIENWYRHGRENAKQGNEEWFKRVMVEHPCPECEGARLKKTRRCVRIEGRDITEMNELHLPELRGFLRDEVAAKHTAEDATSIILREIDARLEVLVDVGLDYLSLGRPSATLSGGESQRIRLASQIGSGLMGMLYIFDEPSIGLHPKDTERMIATLSRLRDIGNTVIVVEHDEATMRAADWIIEMGPGAGVHGGELISSGPIETVIASGTGLTSQYLRGERSIAVPQKRRTPRPDCSLTVVSASQNNLQNIDVNIPLGVLICLTGPSGSGKSSLLHEIVYKKLWQLKHDSRTIPGAHGAFLGHESIDAVIEIDQSPIGHNSRSNPATYTGFFDNLRKLFANTEMAKERGYKPGRFSFNVKGGRCAECQGNGSITTKLAFMPDVDVVCPTCKGARFNAQTLEVTYKGLNIAQILELSIEDACQVLSDVKSIQRKLTVLDSLGLGYLTVGHPAPLLSGGEAQRVKLAGELSKLKRGKHHLYILDEPTTGLHFADIQRLLDSLNRLVEQGHTVVLIEHNLDVIKTADWVIDLGPNGGHQGGRVIAEGPPEAIAACGASHTGRFLCEVL